ncbi:hypothetical protein K501DRAFT_268085 [Backusella circina FSU 941]|nr:hypothetical protein K501DRAFT_268085 [Backusella circina FSU 941]
MTSSNTRSSRSSKKTASEIPKIKLNINKKKKRTRKDASVADLENKIQNHHRLQQEHSEIDAKEGSLPIDVSEHPEYVRLISQLDKSKSDRLKRVENWRNYEHQSIKDWFAAQKKQAWDDFYFARQKARSDLVQEVQQKIVKLKQELSHLNKQCKQRNYKNVTLKIGFHQKDFMQLISFLYTLHCLYVDKQTNHILNLSSSLRSFVGGASNDEIDRDMMYARQPYNGANTPKLVYSDYESRSTTTDTAEEEVEEHEEGERRRRGEEEEVERSPSVVTNTTMMSERMTPGDNIIHRNDIPQQQVHHPIRNILPPPTPSASSSAFHNSMYPQPPHPPPYGFEEISAERWWPFRSTTAA